MEIEVRELTVGELKKALENVPETIPVRLSSDTGVDQGYGEIIVERAWYSESLKQFHIYANDRESSDLEMISEEMQWDIGDTVKELDEIFDSLKRLEK